MNNDNTNITNAEQKDLLLFEELDFNGDIDKDDLNCKNNHYIIPH